MGDVPSPEESTPPAIDDTLSNPSTPVSESGELGTFALQALIRSPGL
jgi:hypothetical protein